MAIFERKILRRIFGVVKVFENWRRRTDSEVYQLYGDRDVTNLIKLGRFRWAAPIARMPADEIPKKMLDGRLFKKRPETF